MRADEFRVAGAEVWVAPTRHPEGCAAVLAVGAGDETFGVEALTVSQIDDLIRRLRRAKSAAFLSERAREV